MKRLFKENSAKDLVKTALVLIKKNALTLEVESIKYLIFALVQNQNLAPDLSQKLSDHNEILLAWLRKIEKGYLNRISIRKSNYPGTMPDEMISKIINARLIRLSPSELKRINDAHRLSMSSENILGLLLEEFLYGNLKKHGWYCAWGESIRSVDFVNENGSLLQVKNRSNSENSSSSKVRHGTPIEKWFRVNANSGLYNWEELNSKIGAKCNLSEELFEAFVKETIRNNPEALAVEPQNSWFI